MPYPPALEGRSPLMPLFVGLLLVVVLVDLAPPPSLYDERRGVSVSIMLLDG